MGRWHSTILLVALAGGAGCQHLKQGETFAHDGYAKVSFEIRGMMKAKSGAT